MGSILIFHDILILLVIYDILISLESIISYIHLPLFPYLRMYVNIWNIHKYTLQGTNIYIPPGEREDRLKKHLALGYANSQEGLYHVICLANMTHLWAKHDKKKQSLVWYSEILTAIPSNPSREEPKKYSHHLPLSKTKNWKLQIIGLLFTKN